MSEVTEVLIEHEKFDRLLVKWVAILTGLVAISILLTAGVLGVFVWQSSLHQESMQRLLAEQRIETRSLIETAAKMGERIIQLEASDETHSSLHAHPSSAIQHETIHRRVLALEEKIK